jgi:hypothetical protein
MTIGCDLVLWGLLLLYLAVLIAKMVISLVLGFLFPWEPPVEEDAPYEAVLRVLAPEDETIASSGGLAAMEGSKRGRWWTRSWDTETIPYRPRLWIKWVGVRLPTTGSMRTSTQGRMRKLTGPVREMCR